MNFPVEATSTKEFRILHRLGNHQYVLTLQLRRGDTVHSRLLQVFQQGQLPGCLFRPSLEFASLAVRESLSDSVEEEEDVELGSDCGNRPAIFFDPGLDAALLELEQYRWPKLLVLDDNKTDQDAEVVAQSASMRKQPWPALTKEMTFWRAFDFLLRHRPGFFRTIGTLEESYLKENRDLQGGRAGSISQLQVRQSIEMENVRQQAENVRMQDEDHAFREVQSLVAQHVGELDAVELHWRTEIEMLKVKQKASYRDLIVDFFEQEIEQLVHSRGHSCSVFEATAPSEEEHDNNLDSRLHSPISSPAKEGEPQAGVTHASCDPSIGSLLPVCPGIMARPLRSENPFSSCPASTSETAAGNALTLSAGGEEIQAAIEDTRLQECCQIRAVFGQQRVFFVIRLWVGDIMDLLHETTTAVTGDDDDGAGPQLPPELVGLGSFGHRYFSRGSVLPVDGVGFHLINAQAIGEHHFLRSGICNRAKNMAYKSPSLRFWAAPSPPRAVRLSPNAYAANLRALVIPTPENLKFETMQPVMLREFANRCDQYTDLHFAPLSKQLQLMRSATEEAPLKIGDYFCTRHSNLGGAVQVAFHLITGSSEGSASDEISTAVHRALKRVVGDCHACHIGELSLPLLLLDTGTSESSLPYAVAQRRSENALRALKGALSQLADELAPSEPPELGVVNLVLPPACAQSINARMPSVVESAITFLRHSFQCV